MVRDKRALVVRMSQVCVCEPFTTVIKSKLTAIVKQKKKNDH